MAGKITKIIIWLILLPCWAIGQTDSLVEALARERYTREELFRMYKLFATKAAARASLHVLDNETAALVALQAFNFNNAASGYPFDSDLHRALISIWDRYHHHITLPIDKSILAATILGPRGEYIFLVDPQGTLFRLKQTATDWNGETLFTLPGYTTKSLLFMNQDGSKIAYARDPGKGKLEVYEIVNGSIGSSKFINLEPPLLQAVFLSNGKDLLILHNAGRTISKFADKDEQRFLLNRSFSKISLSPCDKFVAGGDGEKYWVSTLDSFKTASPHDVERVSTLEFSPNDCVQVKSGYGYRLVLGTDQGEWMSAYLGSRVHPWQSRMGRGNPLLEIVFSNKAMWMGAQDGTSVQIWHWENPYDIPIEILTKAPVKHFAFSPNEDYVLIQTDSIRAYPIDTRVLAAPLCNYLQRNMTKDEWNMFFSNLPYERTCSKHFANYK